MPRCTRLIVVMVFALALDSRTIHAQLSPRGARVEVLSPKGPIPVLANGQRVLVYELHVTNLGQGPLVFQQIEVFDGGRRGAPIATYRDAALGMLLQPVGGAMHGMAMGDTAMGGNELRLDPGKRTVAFLWLTFAPGSLVPTTLRHRLLFDILDSADMRRDAGTQASVDSVFVPVMAELTPLIRAPLDSGEWVMASGPSNQSSHRRTVTAVGGKAWSAERFAIDWNMVGPNGNTFRGDEHENASYWGFGQPVHAVADGEVVAVVDSIADHAPHGPIPPVTLANIAGNYVIIRIAPHRYVSYAHLQRGSVRVHVHQRVVRSAVIALLGNTGQSSAPHLHFQVTDAPSFLAAEGVPFRLERFDLLAMASEFEEGKFLGVARRGEMPMEDQVIRLRR